MTFLAFHPFGRIFRPNSHRKQLQTSLITPFVLNNDKLWIPNLIYLVRFKLSCKKNKW